MKPQPVKYCADCGVVIAGPDTEPHRYNRIRYCPDCAKDRKLWSDTNAQKQRRLDRKECNRLLRQQCALLLRENTELRRRIDTLEKVNQEVRGYV